MKRPLHIICFIALIAFSSHLQAQEESLGTDKSSSRESLWADKSSSLSAYATAGLGIHLNIGYDYLKFTGNLFHGFTAGATVMYFEGVTFGPHLTYNLMVGLKNHHLETRFGGAVPFDSEKVYLTFIPVVSLAYRYQKPEGNGFFRVGINTGGIGIGGGVILK